MKAKKLNIRSGQFNPKKHIKENKCKCNECGKVWHYLDSDKKVVKRQAQAHALYGCGTCGSPWGAWSSSKSIDLSQKSKSFDKCPGCNSMNIKKSVIYYEKK